MSEVRAKMTCTSIEGSMVKFDCFYDVNNKPEDNSFSEATPYGKAEYSISNPAALEKIEKGKSYYFDITPCE